MTWPPPVTLTHAAASLVPLSRDHAPALARAAAELGQLWYTSIPTPDGMATEIARRLSLPDMQPFTVLCASGTPVGMTTYMNTDAANRRVEIGSTWLAPQVQRSKVNTACKLMLLTHAFETLDCIAVEFRTHRMNRQSRAAIERLGAQLDGILRAHMVMPNGTLRDTAVYSITRADWPTSRAQLTARLA